MSLLYCTDKALFKYQCEDSQNLFFFYQDMSFNMQIKEALLCVSLWYVTMWNVFYEKGRLKRDFCLEA